MSWVDSWKQNKSNKTKMENFINMLRIQRKVEHSCMYKINMRKKVDWMKILHWCTEIRIPENMLHSSVKFFKQVRNDEIWRNNARINWSQLLNINCSDFNPFSDGCFLHNLEFRKFFLTNQNTPKSVQIAKNYPHIIFGKVRLDGCHIPQEVFWKGYVAIIVDQYMFGVNVPGSRLHSKAFSGSLPQLRDIALGPTTKRLKGQQGFLEKLGLINICMRIRVSSQNH